MMAERSEGKPSVTVKELMQIIATEFGCIMLPGNDLDQVYPGVYIGDALVHNTIYVMFVCV